MAPAVPMRPLVLDWHSLTKADHCRPAADRGEGSGPAPIELGSKNAEMADSEDVLGPHVPPAAGAGSGTRTMVAAATRYEMATTRHKTRTTPTTVMGRIVREEDSEKGSARLLHRSVMRRPPRLRSGVGPWSCRASGEAWSS